MAEVIATTATDRNLRKTRVGIVTSNKMDKSITVMIEKKVKHPKYGKIMKRRTKLHAHDENQIGKVGDTVRIQETRPLSKMKSWILIEVI